jgi:hypothetical protein
MEAGGWERAGVLVLRAWVEDTEDQGLRVRIIRIAPNHMGAATEPVNIASATVDGVCATVRAWLEEVMDRPQPWSAPDQP